MGRPAVESQRSLVVTTTVVVWKQVTADTCVRSLLRRLLLLAKEIGAVPHRASTQKCGGLQHDEGLTIMGLLHLNTYFISLAMAMMVCAAAAIS